MQDLVKPLIDQASKHKEQFIHNIHALNDYEERINFLEYVIFKRENGGDRFEEVFKKMAQMEETRV